MTMYEVLDPRDDVDEVYVSRKDGGRGYNDSKITNKSLEEDGLELPETILTTRGSTRRK